MAQSATTTRASSLKPGASITLVDHFKPHRSEALQRLRLNGFSLLTLFLLSNLLPLPSLQSAFHVLMAKEREEWNFEWWWKWGCLLEATIALTLTYNVFESVYALKYPRAPLPPVNTPAKSKSLAVSTPTPKRAFTTLSPFTSPQPQKPFTPTASFSASTFLSSSPTKYQATPQATPSRVMQYSMPSSGSPNTSISSILSSPSPLVSAYRSKNAASVGHALDSSYLSHVYPTNNDDSGDEDS
ncbi:hypothetical protein BDN72DRAFT_889940 [Pluteus cervinus]|uniref:Uncharacterized protein n=1 Tax=Pluteus cervinus TaxID=181527 RepID=A0ACD3AAU0_9AGAR|nr:hypothetical protein BDN72DRAFT_889940 [Pluteus cervinus]